MKILFSGYHNPHFVTITEYVERAIVAEGHRCDPFEDRQFLIPGRIRKRLKSLHKWDIDRINRRLIDLVEKAKPDLCWVSGGHRISADTISKIKQLGVTTILWTIDPPRDFEILLEVASAYDYIVCGGTEAMEIYQTHGVKHSKWFPFACDINEHRPMELTEKDYQKYGSDVVFVGSYYPNRFHILAQLTDFNIAVWGPGWGSVPESSILSPYLHAGQYKPEEWLKIYRASKIVLILHYQDGKIPCHQASPKVFETLAAKGFVLCDAQKDVRTLFKEGKHMDFFETVEDLKRKIAFYLDRPDKRAAIAEAGHIEITMKHTYRHRVRQLLNIIS